MEYRQMLNEAKELQQKWDACENDTQRILLASTTGKLLFTLDNDNTTVTYQQPGGLTQAQSDELFEQFALRGLENDLGNRSGVELLLGILKIPCEYC